MDLLFRLLLVATLGYPLCMYSMEMVIHKQPNDPFLIKLREDFSRVPMFEPQKALEMDPTLIIKPLDMQERPGVCYNYAIKKIFKNHGITQNFNIIGCQDWKNILQFFEEIKDSKDYKIDDLVIYKEEDRIVHFGLLANPQSMLVESKWGTIKALFTHQLFHLPSNWGTLAAIVRLKKECQDGPHQNSLVSYIRNNMEKSLYQQQTLMCTKICLIDSANCSDVNTWPKTLNEIRQILEQVPAISVNICNGLRQTLLMIAVKNNNYLLAKVLLEYGAKKEFTDIGGRTALFFAKQNKNEELQKLLA